MNFLANLTEMGDRERICTQEPHRVLLGFNTAHCGDFLRREI